MKFIIKMKRLQLIAANLIILLTVTVSCVDLDITPTTVITAEAVYNETGIRAYMAGMYRYLPMEDFMYDSNNSQANANAGSHNGYFNRLKIACFWTFTGENTNRNNDGTRRHNAGYYSNGFRIVRQANTLITNLPDYPELGDPALEWIAEAKFIRAYVYFQFVKRYGGMPIIEAPQVQDPNDESALWIARSSHADTYDFILRDLDDAIDGLPETSVAGRANRYVAAAFKSRVALHAATTARYGSAKFPDWEVDGVLLQGIPANRANNYFQQSWDAAKMLEGVYHLHRGNPDKVANYAEIWERTEAHSENIWLKKYDRTLQSHSFNSLFGPPRMQVNGGDRYNPTLDWVELFDGLPLDEHGRFSAFDNAGNYIVYNTINEMWENAEPRLQANLLLPGNIYRELRLDVRAGVFHESIDPDEFSYKKFSIDDGATGSWYNNDSQFNTADYTSNQIQVFRNQGLLLTSTREAQAQTADDVHTRDDGTGFYKTGFHGPKMSWAEGNNTKTGLYGRKHLNVTQPASYFDHHIDTQPWIEIRYAEVLLNRAEAALELFQDGETTFRGVNMQQDAYECINDIRDRAGAVPLASPAELSEDAARINYFPSRVGIGPPTGPTGQGGFVHAPNRGLQIIRVERYKELAFESKIYWDLLRWFTFDTQINQYRIRGLYSFMFAKGAVADEQGRIEDGRFIFDAKIIEQQNVALTFNANWYYETIPNTELQNNPLLQRNRNQ